MLIRFFALRSIPSYLIGLVPLLTCAVSCASAARMDEQPVAPLVVDESYAPLLENTGGGFVTCAVLDNANRAVIGGTFEFANNAEHRYFAALLADGSLDPDFAAAGGPDGQVLALVAQPDGTLLVGGRFRHFAGQPAAGLVRLRANGSLDPKFKTPIRVNGVVAALALQADGRILVGGGFDQFAGAAAPGLVRLQADGTRDDSFKPAIGAKGKRTQVLSVSVMPGGGVAVVVRHAVTDLEPLDPAAWPQQGLAKPTSFLARLQSDGGVDPTFKLQRTTDLVPAVVCALPSGELMLAGSGELLRISRDGSVDGRFRFEAQNEMRVHALLPLDDERLLVAGDAWGEATLPARLLIVGRDGWIKSRLVMPRDESHVFLALAHNERGRVLAAGQVAPAVERLSFSKTENRVLLLDENFGVDRRFRANVGASGRFTAVAPDGRGGLTLAGVFKSGEGLTGTSIMRLQADGSPDRVFQPTGRLFGLPHVLVPVPDGGVVVGGMVNTAIDIRTPRPVIRLRGDGTPFQEFIPDVPVGGYFTDGTLLTDGTVVLVGSLAGHTPDRNFSDLIRFDLAGKVDRRLAETVPSWLASATGRLLAVAETAHGKLLVGGEFSRLQDYPRPAIARVGGGGVVDPSFVPQTDDFSVIATIVPLNNQRVFIDGWAKPVPDHALARIFARLLPDGRRDPSYRPPADFGGREPLLAHVLADGTTLVVLHDPAPDATATLHLVRLDPGGAVMPDFDITLGNHGANLKILPNADGSVYLVGDVPELNGSPRYGLGRLVPKR